MNVHNIFISHTQKTSGESEDWIKDLAESLLKLYNTYFSGEIRVQSTNTITTPNDLNNFDAFIVVFDELYSSQEASQNEYLRIKEIVAHRKNNAQHLFPIRRIDISLPEDEVLLERYVYDFFYYQPKSNELIELSGKDENRNKFWYQLVDLAFDLSAILFDDSVNIGNNQQTIYLAETGKIQFENRNAIKRELQHRGYNVVPAKPLSFDLKIAEQQIKSLLESAVFSIHILGASNYTHFNNQNAQIVDIQNILAAQHYDELNNETHNNSFQRLIWIPPDLVLKDEKQLMYIETLRRDAEALSGAEIIQTPLEVFKQIVREKIIASQKDFIKRKESSLENEIAKPLVYIISEMNNNEGIDELKNKIETAGGISVSLQEEESKSLVQTHRQHLIHCDFSVINYVNGNVQWLNSKLNDLMKSPGFGRIKPIGQNIIINKSGKEIDENLIERNKYANVSIMQELSIDTLNHILNNND